MGQFEKNWTQKDITMNIRKLLEDSDPLIAAAELHERLPKKVQNAFIIAVPSLDRRKNAGNTESSKKSSYVLSSFTLKFCCKTYTLNIQMNNPFVLF